MTLELVCGWLNCDVVHRRFIAPFTAGKMLFPQITLRMVREIRLPAVDTSMAREIFEAVRDAELGAVGAEERVQILFASTYESADVEE